MNFDFDMNTLMIVMLAGCVGTGFFIYGKKQQKFIPMVCGLALMVYPFFVSNLWLTLLVGLLFCAIPYFLRF